MAVQTILSTDTLESGFRVKYNQSVNEIIVNSTLLTDNIGAYTGILRLIKFNGGFINVDLSGIYYTKAQIGALIAAISSSPYSGSWANPGSGPGYSSQNVVDHNGILWRSITNNNIDEPGTSAVWINILDSTSNTIEIDFPAGVSTDFNYDYSSVGSVARKGLEIYAEQYYTDAVIDPSLTNIFIPYTIQYFKIQANNHILFRKSDPGDHVKITLKL